MEPTIIQVALSVDIAASPDRVFALVSDAAAKAALNPSVRVIRIEQETPGPLRAGTTTFYRLQKGTHLFEYRMQCVRCEPGRLIESHAQLPTKFSVRVEVEPAAGGSRLSHTEECEVSPEMLERFAANRREERSAHLIETIYLFLPALARGTLSVIFRGRVDALRTRMQRELSEWLQAIKAHLESEHHAGSPSTADARGGPERSPA